jgi:uncharacterized membrane protein YbhN (UPF0104 family)
VKRTFHRYPVAISVFAMAIAGLAVILIAQATGVDAIGRAFERFDGAWVALVAVGSLLTYPAYIAAYRSIACIGGHPPLALATVARVVVAGFGPFAVAGGFGIDKEALHALHEDEHSARVRVMALGTLEWAVLAPTACVVSIVLLAQGTKIMASLLWPWALAVPAGFALALWASSPRRAERLSRIGGRHRAWMAQGLQGVGVLRGLLRHPGRHRGAWIGTVLYWVADIAAFYGAVRAFGLTPGAGKVIIAYATGYAATRRSLPLGGAGVTEALMTYSLYWVGEPLAPALGAVLAYRLFNLIVISAPAVLAQRQLQPLLSEADGPL